MSIEGMADDSRHDGKGRRRKVILYLVSAALIIAAEAAFDVLEIGVGRLLLLSNPLRPQTGRLWDEDHKEKMGIDELAAIPENSAETVSAPPIRTMEELQLVLATRGTLNMNREEFKNFYIALPVKQAKRVFDPLSLLELFRNPEWRRVQLSQNGDQLVIYFLDGYDNPLQESHLSLQPQETEAEGTFADETLDQKRDFSDRIVEADVFMQAFDRLDRSMRLQIVNDPYKLVQWGNSLQRVGIAPSVTDEGVEFVFEVKTTSGTALYAMHASEIAAAYLIAEINSLIDSPKLKPPVRQDEED